MLVSDAGAHTGFAQVAHQIFDRLVTDYGHEVHVLAANYKGDAWDTPMKLYVPNFDERHDFLGQHRIIELMAKVMPDAVVFIQDPKVVLDILHTNPWDKDKVLWRGMKGSSGYLYKPPIVAYLAVDGYDNPRAWDVIAERVTRVAMTHHGQAAMPEAPVIWHGVDTEVFHPGDKREAKVAMGFDPDRFLVLRVDKNSWRKDYPSSWQALAPVLRRHPDIDVHFHCRPAAADGYDLKHVMWNDEDIRERVTFTPNLGGFTGLDQAQLATLYRAADLFLSTSWGEGFGLCVDPSTPIVVPGGVKPMADVLRGDTVLTRDGWRPVIDKIARTAPARLAVRASGLGAVTVTPEHPFLVRHRGKRTVSKMRGDSDVPTWVRAGDLRKGDYLAFPRPKWDRPLPESIDILDYLPSGMDIEYDDESVWMRMGYSPKHSGLSIASVQREYGVKRHTAENALRVVAGREPHKEYAGIGGLAATLVAAGERGAQQVRIRRHVQITDEFLEFVGWYIAEGSAHGGSGIQLDLGPTGWSSIPSLGATIQRAFGIEAIVQDRAPKKVRTIHASSSVVSALMVSLAGNGAARKRIPFWRSARYLGPLVRGYIRGDGHAAQGGYLASTVSADLAWQLWGICAAVGIPLSLFRKPLRSPWGTSDFYQVGALGSAGVAFATWANLPVRSVSRRARGSSQVITNDFIYTPLRSIESIGPGEVMDIEVAGAHEFVGGGLLLHNTILEAMASGTPVVAQDCSAITEVVGPGGILIKPSRKVFTPMGQKQCLPDVERFTYWIEHLYNATRQREALARAAVEHAATFSWDEAARRMNNVITQAIEQAAQSA